MANLLTAAAMAATGFAITASVAVAEPREPAPGDTNKTTPNASAKARPAEQRYCIVQVITGSRIPNRECKTLREWRDQGVDPLNP